MNDTTPEEFAALLLHEDMAFTKKQQIAGTLRFENAADVRRIVLELTGSEEQAEAAVYRWRADQLAEGRRAT